MPMYTKHVYPLISQGASHVRPPIPGTFAGVHEISVTWDIHSANEDDRAEYWEDSAGILTAAEVEEAVYGVDGKDAWIAANPDPLQP